MFVVIGVVGVVLLVLALLFDDVIDGLLPDSELLSLPVVATAMVAFGFGTAVLTGQAGWPLGAAAGGGAVLAMVGGAGAVRAGRAALDMATDATPTSKDLVGSTGRVVTPIVRGSIGEIVVRLGGQPVKLTASLLVEDPGASDTDSGDPRPIATGTEVVVVSVVSPTRVVVQEATRFWADR